MQVRPWLHGSPPTRHFFALMHKEQPDRYRQFAAGAALLAAFLYAGRSGQALSAGELDHMSHTVNSGQPLVVMAAAVMAAALLGLRVSGLVRSGARASTALMVASIGLLWVGAARLIELLGATGPWGFYSSPGLVAFVGGLAVAGFTLNRGERGRSHASPLAGILVAIALLHMAAGLVSMSLFNVLGRDVGANAAATQAGHIIRLLEALLWLALAARMARTDKLWAVPRAG